MNKILMDRDEKELILAGKYVFKENGTFSLEIKDLEIGSRISKGDKLIKTGKGESVVAYKVFSSK